jgi:hypothetical protein
MKRASSLGLVLLPCALACERSDPPPVATTAPPPPATAPPLPPLVPTPEELAQAPEPSYVDLLPGATLDSKLPCPAGTKQVTSRDPLKLGIWCEEHGADGGARKSGPAFEFHKNGARHTEGRYLHGKRVGHWVAWSDRGEKQSESEWEDGVLNGLYLSYWPNGRRSAEVHYERGVKVLEKTWDDQGKMIAVVVYEGGAKKSERFFP